jgi:hypothetical protein
MSKTYSYNNFNVTTVDIKTVFHNRGTVPVSVPNQIQIAASPGGASGNITASRVLSGNHIDICKPGASYKNAKNINAIHDNHAYVYVSGYRWKQYRTLVAGDSYAFVPTRDTHSVFNNNAGTSATLTLDLSDTSIIPGMCFGLAALGAGTTILTLTNGSIVNPATGAIGTTVTVSQFGFAVIRLIGAAGALGGVNEVVTLTEATNITAGTYTLTFGGQTTAAIAWDATAAQVQAALEALSTIGVGNILVTGMVGGLTAAPATLTFVNALGNRDVGAVTSNQAGLTGTFTIAVPTPGVTSAKLFIEDAAGTVVS